MIFEKAPDLNENVTDRPAPGVVEAAYWVVGADGRVQHGQGVPDERLLAVYINGQELVSITCSPLDAVPMVVGFLFCEGVIERLDEILHIQVNATGGLVDVFLNRREFQRPHREILTSGCGVGVAFQLLTEAYPAIESDFVTRPAVLFDRMRDLYSVARVYQQVRGIHTSILADTQRVWFSAEDIGRHNTIDKLAGKALLAGMDASDALLLTSGRVSSEMLSKARRMGVAVVGSRTSPTAMAVQLAEAWQMTLVGYIGQRGLRVYTHPWRLGLDGP